jgi:hypothetical protein
LILEDDSAEASAFAFVYLPYCGEEGTGEVFGVPPDPDTVNQARSVKSGVSVGGGRRVGNALDTASGMKRGKRRA